MKNPELKALIFDVDGTLADTERDGHRVAFNAAFEEYNIDWNWDVDLYEQLLAVTGGKERMKYCMTDFLGKENLPDNFETLIPALHEAKTRHYTELLATGAIPLRQGVERLFHEALNKNLKLAIATTTTPDNVTALLTHTLGADSLNWFEVIAAGDIVPAKKPAGDIYFYAMKKMQLEPDQCLAFEDSHNGLLSARSANLATLITINHYTRNHDFTGAALVLDNMGEPDQPFNVIQGDVHGQTMVNYELLLALHQQFNH